MRRLAPRLARSFSTNPFIAETYKGVYGSNPPRDLVGYGRNPPDPKWPGGANIAVQFVINYEVPALLACILYLGEFQLILLDQ
jgi:hypothetical protein